MAELNVEPKKSSPWIWIVIGIIIIAIILFFVFRNNGNNTDNVNNGRDTTTSQVITPSNTENPVAANAVAATEPWQGINYNAPKATYGEITNKDIDVRADDKYALYSLGENILFDVDKSTIRTEGESNLKQVAQSIKQRYDNDKVKIYGFTDSTASKDYNKELGKDRAEAVKSYLVKNGDLNENNISLQSMGEAMPVANNGTSKGRQENRRVKIIVKRST